jgi:hypothetical protein
MKFNSNLILYLLVSLVIILLFSQFFNMTNYEDSYLVEDFRMRDLTPEQRTKLQEINKMRPAQIKLEKERINACRKGCNLLSGRDRALCNQKCNQDLSRLMMYHGSLIQKASRDWEKNSGLRLRDYRYSPQDDIGAPVATR